MASDVTLILPLDRVGVSFLSTLANHASNSGVPSMIRFTRHETGRKTRRVLSEGS